MATVTAGAEVKAPPSELWSLWTEPLKLQAWLPVCSVTGPLIEGNPFCWQAMAPFVDPVSTTGRVLRLDPGRALELEIDMKLSPAPSRLFVQFSGSPGENRCKITIRHEDLPEDDLGSFESNGYSHYWLQHLESLTSFAENRPSDHHHRLHVGVYFTGGHRGLGVLVGGVLAGSPVHDAGLRAGDLLHSVNGNPVRSIVEFDEWLDAAIPGTTAQFSLFRTELCVKLPDQH